MALTPIRALLALHLMSAPAFSAEPCEAEIISGSYNFGARIAKSPNGDLHLMSRRSENHYWGGWSEIQHYISQDAGKTWRQMAPVSPTNRNVLFRSGAFGISASGKLVNIGRWRRTDNENWSVFVASTSDANNWTINSAPSIKSKDGTPTKVTAYGDIQTLPSGRMIVAAYFGRFLVLLSSVDEGTSWEATTIAKSETMRFSEAAILPIDERRFVAVSRIDHQKNSMGQFSTDDSGATWRFLGQTNLPSSRHNVAPSLNILGVGPNRRALLAYCDRDKKKCNTSVADPERLLSSAAEWGPVSPFALGIKGLSGYQSLSVEPDGRSVIVSYTREVSDLDSRIFVSRGRWELGTGSTTVSKSCR